MKKVLDLYKFIYKSMGPKSIILLAVVLMALFISIRSYYNYGDPIGIYITGGLLAIYHVAFALDMKKKNKMKKK